MSHPFDATLKDILAQAPAGLRKPFRLPAIEPAQTLNVDLSTISAATDVAIGFGAPLQQIADVNFQSGPDPHVAARLLVYNAALHLKFRVPVKSVLVLLRPKADYAGILGSHSYTCCGKRVVFEYDVIRLWQEPIEPLLEGSPELLPLAPLCKLPRGASTEQALTRVIQEIDRRLSRLADHAKAVRLMTATFVLSGLRVPKENLSSLYEGVRIMQKVAWDQYIDEGKVLARRHDLLAIGRKRLGEPSARIEAALTAIEDPDRLERMMDVVLDVKSWKALLAIK